MPCERCSRDAPLNKAGWCAACDRVYDGWVRQYAADVIWPLMLGMTVLTSIAMLAPMLGVNALVMAAGAGAGVGTFYGLTRYNQRRRRRQFLSSSVPRAYLRSKT
jgi:hypothetical protein